MVACGLVEPIIGEIFAEHKEQEMKRVGNKIVRNESKFQGAEMLSYALATEHDAITMYTHMIETMPLEYHEKLQHILDEEKEHAEMLLEMLGE